MTESLESYEITHPKNAQSEKGQDNEKPNSQNIWDKMEVVKDILESEKPLSEEDKQKVENLLNQIASETEDKEKQLTSYFDDNIYSKLKTLFPDNPFFSEDVKQFSNSIELLPDGEKAFAEIINQIDNAKTSIEINIFIWRNDGIGNIMAQKLIEAANRGVKITINKDRLGALFEHAEQSKKSFFHPQLADNEILSSRVVDKMYVNQDEAQNHTSNQSASPLLAEIIKHPNIKVNAGDIKETKINVGNNESGYEEKSRTSAIGRRNDHSKYYIFDNKTVITGGMNIGDEYHTKWHDYMVKMESPLLVEKMKARLNGQDDFDYGSSMEFSLNRVEDGVVKSKEFEPKAIELIKSAKSEIIVEMAYFGDADITQAIIDKANNGVPIKIILPNQANVQDDLNKKVMEKILNETNGNVSVYFYPTMLHAKLMQVDQEKTFLGSANFNKKATEDLGEFNILVNDADCDFTVKMNQQLKNDIEKCKAFVPPPKIEFSKIKSFLEGLA